MVVHRFTDLMKHRWRTHACVTCGPTVKKNIAGVHRFVFQRSGLVPQGQGLINGCSIVQKGELSHPVDSGDLDPPWEDPGTLTFHDFHGIGIFCPAGFSAFFGSAEETNSRSDGKKWRCNPWWQVLQVSGKLFDGLKSIMSITYIEIDLQFFTISHSSFFFWENAVHLKKTRVLSKKSGTFLGENMGGGRGGCDSQPSELRGV